MTAKQVWGWRHTVVLKQRKRASVLRCTPKDIYDAVQPLKAKRRR